MNGGSHTSYISTHGDKDLDTYGSRGIKRVDVY